MAHTLPCGADILANQLLTTLVSGEDFSIPPIDLNGIDFQLPSSTLPGGTVDKLTNLDLTTTNVGGLGTFDMLMTAVRNHLKEEYEADRISGAEYTKAYQALTQSAMQNATQYALGRDQAYWGAIIQQRQAAAAEVAVIQAKVQLNIAKMQFAQLRAEANNAKVTYAANKLKLSTESINFCTAEFNLEQMLPKQKELLDSQVLAQIANTETAQYNLTNILPKQKDLLIEQIEVQHAQVSDTMTDGITPIRGLSGSQKALYDQQKISYIKDEKLKGAKLLTDLWFGTKTLNDKDVKDPQSLNYNSINHVLNDVKIMNGIGNPTPTIPYSVSDIDADTKTGVFILP